MNKVDSIREFIKNKAEEFGANTDTSVNRSYIERNNTNLEALQDNGAYFGFIHPEEEISGPYHDFSFNIFPSNDESPWLLCLGIGSLGFKNDYELATFPGLRRLFSKLIDEDGFCKSDFSDIETGLPKSFTGNPKIQHLKNSIKMYTKVLPACQIIEDPDSEKGRKKISAFLAGYAKIREWPSNNDQRKAISAALTEFLTVDSQDDITEIKKLLLTRKFVVIQGPPGTGKTRAAKMVANGLEAATFFTQFHAETSYSDFIFGIRPDIDSKNLMYKEYLGEFSKAVKHAVESKEKTCLIIDEINRASLSNVLGPIFYLFEYKQNTTDIEIEIFPGYRITRLPENLFVIATMNTADRSLAVVDFALRRRFAWYTMLPKEIQQKDFYRQDFLKFSEIFEWYASHSELNLQPGQGYFIAATDEEMQDRVRYELLTLVREYLQEGLLLAAKEEFNNYFKMRIGEQLFE